MWMQYLVVGIIVLAAVLFAAWRLPGDRTRLRYVAGLKRLGSEGGGLHRFALRLQSGIDRRAAASACGSCGSAAGRPAPAPPERQRR